MLNITNNFIEVSRYNPNSYGEAFRILGPNGLIKDFPTSGLDFSGNKVLFRVDTDFGDKISKGEYRVDRRVYGGEASITDTGITCTSLNECDFSVCLDIVNTKDACGDGEVGTKITGIGINGEPFIDIEGVVGESVSDAIQSVLEDCDFTEEISKEKHCLYFKNCKEVKTLSLRTEAGDSTETLYPEKRIRYSNLSFTNQEDVDNHWFVSTEIGKFKSEINENYLIDDTFFAGDYFYITHKITKEDCVLITTYKISIGDIKIVADPCCKIEIEQTFQDSPCLYGCEVFCETITIDEDICIDIKPELDVVYDCFDYNIQARDLTEYNGVISSYKMVITPPPSTNLPSSTSIGRSFKYNFGYTGTYTIQVSGILTTDIDGSTVKQEINCVRELIVKCEFNECAFKKCVESFYLKMAKKIGAKNGVENLDSEDKETYTTFNAELGHVNTWLACKDYTKVNRHFEKLKEISGCDCGCSESDTELVNPVFDSTNNSVVIKPEKGVVVKPEIIDGQTIYCVGLDARLVELLDFDYLSVLGKIEELEVCVDELKQVEPIDLSIPVPLPGAEPEPVGTDLKAPENCEGYVDFEMNGYDIVGGNFQFYFESKSELSEDVIATSWEYELLESCDMKRPSTCRHPANQNEQCAEIHIPESTEYCCLVVILKETTVACGTISTQKYYEIPKKVDECEGCDPYLEVEDACTITFDIVESPSKSPICNPINGIITIEDNA